jgi:hypothetical protein
VTPLPPGFQPFSAEDRQAQLAELEARCRRAASVCRPHDARRAQELEALAGAAAGLLEAGHDQAALTELAAGAPRPPGWTDPRALDAGLPLEPWQAEVAPDLDRIEALAVLLRTLARR